MRHAVMCVRSTAPIAQQERKRGSTKSRGIICGTPYDTTKTVDVTHRSDLRSNGEENSATANEICRKRTVNLSRVWQIQIGHDLCKFLLAFGQPWVCDFLGLDGGAQPPLVVVRRVDDGVVWQREELVVDRVVEVGGRSLLEVGAAAAADEQHIAREDGAQRLAHERDAAVGVPRRREHAQQRPAVRPADALALLEHHVRLGARCGGDGGAQPAHALLQLARASDVVRVAVRVQSLRQRQALRRDHLQVAIHLLEDGVDDDGLLGLAVGQDVGVGRRAAALRLGPVEELGDRDGLEVVLVDALAEDGEHLRLGRAASV
mmetsp:Transcript_21532/g.47023  ORF Transcript_21532/g.47023 Transcript_21532/m.47023 type:complete len:318 (+) Transcript_21532:329-1282(+)